MGLPIGQAPATLSTLSGTRNVRPPSFFDQAERSPVQILGQDDSSNQNALLNRSKRDTVQVGLGSGTFSGPAAALKALSRTVADTKKLVPSISELEIRLRRQASDSRAQVREAFQGQILGSSPGLSRPEPLESFQSRTPSRIEFRRPDATAQTRNFINAINETAGALQAQFSDEPQEPPSTGASFQINGESFPVRQTTPGARLNITV